jgi:hypothetical protein
LREIQECRVAAAVLPCCGYGTLVRNGWEGFGTNEIARQWRSISLILFRKIWLRRQDLNLRPSGKGPIVPHSLSQELFKLIPAA